MKDEALESHYREMHLLVEGAEIAFINALEHGIIDPILIYVPYGTQGEPTSPFGAATHAARGIFYPVERTEMVLTLRADGLEAIEKAVDEPVPGRDVTVVVLGSVPGTGRDRVRVFACMAPEIV